MVSIGPTIGIKGEKAFRASIREIIAEAKLLDSEMDKLSATFEKGEWTMNKYEKTSEVLTKQIDQQEKAIEKLKEARDKATDILQKNTEAYEKQRKETEEVNKTYVQHLNKLNDIEFQYGKNSKQYKEAKEAFEKQTDALNDSNKALTDAETKMHNSAATVSEWERRINQAEVELHNFKEELKDHSPIKAFGQTLEDWGGKLEDVGTKLSTYITAPLTALGAAAIKASSDFTDGMAKIYTIAFESSEPMEKMRQELIQLSNDTAFGLDDLAEATYQTVSASVDATEAVEFMTQATKLARAGFTTTTKSVDVLTTILNSYGKETYDVAYINDVLLKTQNDGKLIIDQLASSLGMIIPLASNYNVGLEQVAAAYATMTKQGVPASKATTFLRAVFTELEKESSDVAKILDKETGKSFAQLMGEGKTLSEVLGILYDKVGGNAEKFQRLFGNVRATQAVAALVTDNFKILDYELERVSNSSGQTDKALEVLETNSLKAKRAANQLKNSAVVLGDTMVEMLAPGFRKAVDKIRELTDGFNSLTDESKKGIVKLGAFAAAAPLVITAAGKIAKAIGAIITNWEILVALHVPALAAFGALAAGLVVVAEAINVSNKEMIAAVKAEYALTEETKANITALEELQTQHDQFKVSMQEETTAVMNNVDYAQRLVDKYNELVNSKGKVKKGHEEEANFILNELAGALGIERDALDKLIDKHGKLSGAIQKTIEDYKQKAYVAIYEQELEEALRREIEAERIHEELSVSLKTATDNYVEANKANRAAINAVNEATKNGEKVTQEMRDEVTRTATELGAAKAAFNEVNDAVNASSQEMWDAQKDVEFYTDKLNNLGKEAQDAAKKVEESGKKIRDDSKKTGTEVNNNLNIDGYNTGANVMKGFAKGISDNAWRASTAASNAGTWAGKALNNSVQVASPSKLTYETGKYFVEGFADAIADGMGEMAMAGRMLGQTAAYGLGSAMPEYGSYTQVSAPISLNVTVNGNVDDSESFARNLADQLSSLLQRETEVFA